MLTFIMYVAAITFAENSLHMTNAYFIPDHQAEKALAHAAKRGVDVKIILAGVTDESLAQYAGEYHYSHLLCRLPLTRRSLLRRWIAWQRSDRRRPRTRRLG